MSIAGARTSILNFALVGNNQDIFENAIVKAWLEKNFPHYAKTGIDAYITIISDDEYAGTIEFNNDGNTFTFLENLVYTLNTPSNIKSIVASLPLSGSIMIDVI